MELLIFQLLYIDLEQLNRFQLIMLLKVVFFSKIDIDNGEISASKSYRIIDEFEYHPDTRKLKLRGNCP